MKQLEQFRTALRAEAGLIEQYEAQQKAKPRTVKQSLKEKGSLK